MGHDHHHHHHHHSDVQSIRVAFFMNLAFTLVEIVGGIFTNSIAILSDAVHDLGDSLALGLAWYFQKVAKQESNKSFSYGYKRFSLLGAIINSIVLVVGSSIILIAAIPRIFHPQHTEVKGMFLLAILGILVNGIAALRLKKGSSINEKVVSLHLLEDVLGWVAILLGSIIMYFFDLPIIDPIMSVGIACFVLFNVYKSIKQSLHIFLQGIPKEIDITEISKELLQLNEIVEVHDLHAWSVDGIYNISTVHIVLNKAYSMENLAEIKQKVRDKLLLKAIQHVTIEFETTDEHCAFERCC
jgi:cobalt-zinc-cadmium efflux system protein